jgi:hypothetical protein
MKKKKLEAKLTKTKKKLAKARTELDAMLAVIDKSGMPKAASKPAAGRKTTRKATPVKKTAAKSAAKKPAAKPRKISRVK